MRAASSRPRAPTIVVVGGGALKRGQAMRGVSRIEAEVVVVGGGGAGLAAVLEAAECGRRVILLEKNPHLGGTTLLAVGSISAGRTPHQRRKGVEDSPEEFFEDMGLFNQQGGLSDRDNLELRRLLAEESPRTLQWLMGMGLEFFGPMPEPPNRHPRMHNVLPNSRLTACIFAGRSARDVLPGGRPRRAEQASQYNQILMRIGGRGVPEAARPSTARPDAGTLLSPEHA